MKILKEILLYVLTFFVGHSAFAQLEKSHISPSPNASAAVSASNVNMNYYSGVANVSIPLHTIAGKDISIPVSLDYQTSGVKVADIASSVGQGWNLNANAFAVTRVMRGLPDGSQPNCATASTGRILQSQIWNTNLENCDAEKDIFYFSYPSRNGMMFLDNSGQPQTMPYQDILVSPGVGSASIGHWKIVDEMGYTYYFGESAASREETTYAGGNLTTDLFTDKYTFISTWYLTRIIAPSGAQVATFAYSPGGNITYYRTGARVLECNTPIQGNTGTRVDLRIVVNSPKYISTIGTDITSCVFGYESDRLDVANALRLATVSFKDFTGTVKKKFHLEAGCFPLFATPLCTRLKLQSLKEGLTSPITSHTFSYNESIALPPYASYYTDHYGYFNKYNGGDFPIDQDPSGVGYPDEAVAKVPGVCTNGRSKDPNANALAGILTEIQLATGGKTVFTYGVQAGARVASVSHYSGSTLVAQSLFSYVGETYKLPVYHYYNIENSNSLIRSSNSYNSINDLNGVNKGYGTVTETLLDGSKIIRTFYNFSDYPDDNPIVGRYRGTDAVGFNFQGGTDINSAPFTPYSSKAWMRGLPKAVSIVDASNNTLSKEEYFFQESTPVSTVWNMAVEVYRKVSEDWGFYVGEYMLRSQCVTMQHQKNYIYDQTDFTKFSWEDIVYTYHNTHKTLPISVLMTNGHQTKTVGFKYPIDFTGTGSPPSSPEELAGGLWALLQWHILTPVEQLEYRYNEANNTTRLVGGSFSTYRKNVVTTRPLLKGIYVLNRSDSEAGFTNSSLGSGGTPLTFDNNYQLMKTFNYNDASHGTAVNLTSTLDSRGVTHNLEYGYNNTLITADYTMLDTIRFRNMSTFNTINGLLTHTDANYQTSIYEYDNFGRLKLVKDDAGNITARYRYNTKNISEFSIGLTTNVSVGVTGQTIVINSTENAEPAGVTKYIWDFGDGQVSEGTSSTQSHVYTSSGSYTIKLAKVNPEYGKLYTTKTITINNP